MKNKKLISMILTLIIIMSSASVLADTNKVVTLGKDLNGEQRIEMMEVFGVEGDAVILEINNAEEREYLEGFISDEKLGTRTISSAYVEILEEGEGIVVQTHNINWVTPDMYQSALLTAGIKDAKVIAAAPFPVSGTGALTGVIKAFEQATGVEISEEQKKVANEEVVKTSELGDSIGQENATNLINKVKEEVVTKDIKNIEEIQQSVRDIAKNLDIELTDKQVEDISNLMLKISKLEIDTEQIKTQLINIGNKISEVAQSEEVQNLFQRIWSAVKAFFKELFKSE